MHAANVRRSLFLEKHQGLTRTFLLMKLFEGKTRNLGGDCWHCFLSLWELVWNCTKDVNFEGKFNSTRFFDYVHLSFSSKAFCMYVCIFSPRVMSDSLRPHGLQHARPPWPSPSPGVCPSSCPLNRWCYPAVSDALFSLYPLFWGTTILFSTVAIPFYISTNTVEKFQFLHILTNTCYFLFDSGHPNGCEVVSYCSFDLHFLD